MTTRRIPYLFNLEQATPRTDREEEAYWAALRARYDEKYPGERARRAQAERDLVYLRAFALVGKSFTLDDEPITDVIAWARENDLTLGELERIGALWVGSNLELGGGAAATFVLARVE